jgi:hypothetical protein
MQWQMLWDHRVQQFASVYTGVFADQPYWKAASSLNIFTDKRTVIEHLSRFQSPLPVTLQCRYVVTDVPVKDASMVRAAAASAEALHLRTVAMMCGTGTCALLTPLPNLVNLLLRCV